ncbi:type I-E CRISPR-associated protein Cse2/CasB [Streptomyces sp. NPDC001985]|uniref:type I-E CRISPR-associated protein Cse2/CasB n=1 Tax=Streptomyces sp. NPDC001985 TaxID=3154406 RepID=UPI00331C8065
MTIPSEPPGERPGPDSGPSPVSGPGTGPLPVSGTGSASGRRLTAWLAGLVRAREYGTLAELRRPTLSENAHIRAGWLDESRREVFEQVAFLFAVYHRGASSPSYGWGSLGTAARAIGTGARRGPADPGAQRLMDRVVASRRPPLRHLQHTIARLRSCDRPPPSWAGLADDLARWGERDARIRYHWAVDFHAPPSRGAGQRQATPTTSAASAPTERYDTT